MKLYEIEEQIEDCFDQETGEILDGQKLEELEMEWEQKIENVCLYIKNLKADSEALKVEKDNFAKRQRTCENKIEALKNYLNYALDGKKFKSADQKCSVSYRSSKSVEVDLEEMMKFDNTDEFLRYKEPEPDKAKIKASIENGIYVPGCKLVEKQSIIIK